MFDSYALAPGQELRAPHPAAFAPEHPALPKGWRAVNALDFCARLPAPPMLDPRDTVERNAIRVRDWLQGAVESRTDKRYWVTRKERCFIGDSRYFKLIASAVAKFIEHDIAPAAYLAWSADQWHADHPKSKPMPIAWALSPKRIESARHWYRSESTWYAARTVSITGAAPRRLMEAKAAMVRALFSLPPDAPDVAVARVAQGALPRGVSFDDLVAAAEAEGKETQRVLNERVAKGDWVWGA